MLFYGIVDVVLEVCIDFWDGVDIYFFSGFDRCVRKYMLVVRVVSFGYLFVWFIGMGYIRIICFIFVLFFW